LWLQSVEIAIGRVEERVRMGGHTIPKATIIRRYQVGLKNFFDLYRPIADGWRLYDNSTGKTSLIALGENQKIDIVDAPVWNLIQEHFQHV
jgi:predicted ABC-type ATPase